jgi:hypothetical protein
VREYPSCDCFDQYSVQEWSELRFHPEEQDTESDGWKHILDLIEEAVADGREEFAPGRDMTPEEWNQIVTLPSTIAKLKSVKHFLLYGSYLVRIPPEIGKMTNLEEFTPYTSYRLHWFPYEITRCKKLRASTVSTRALYGNYKHRPPFPRLQPDRASTEELRLDDLPPGVWGARSIDTCSVCGSSLDHTGLYQAWISLPVATDVLPLLVNACSEQCIRRLPKPTDNYVQEPHKGGLDVKQPPTCFAEIIAEAKKE